MTDGDLHHTAMMQTITEGLIVKKPESELASPALGKFGSVSIGATHLPGVGPAITIALHHKDGSTLIGVMGAAGHHAFSTHMNVAVERIAAGEFNAPETLQ